MAPSRARLISLAFVLSLFAGACGSDSVDNLASVDTDQGGTEAGSIDDPGPDGNLEPEVEDDIPEDPGSVVLEDRYCATLQSFDTLRHTEASDDEEETWPQAPLELKDTMSYEDFYEDEAIIDRLIEFERTGVAVLEADYERCGIETGWSISIDQDDIDEAAGWVDITAEVEPLCTVIDDETFAVELANEGTDRADYELTVAFYLADGSENVDGGSLVSIRSLRPGELTVHEGWSLFDGTGETCEVVQTRRASSSDDGPEPEDSCIINGRDESGYLDFDVSVIATEDGQVWPTVAFLDADGVRRATHQGWIEEATVGEIVTVGDTNISGEDAEGVVDCEVVSRINF